MAVSNFLSRQSIINQAVIAARLSATGDVKAEKYSATADDLYDEVVGVALEYYPWRWPSVVRDLIPKRVNGQLVQSNHPSGNSIAGTYSTGRDRVVYEDPNGYRRLIGIWYRHSDIQVDYNVDSDGIHAEYGDLVVRYILNLPETRWPATFARIVELEIAHRISFLYNGERTSDLESERDKAVRNAVAVDQSSRGGKQKLFDLDLFTRVRNRAFTGSLYYGDNHY